MTIAFNIINSQAAVLAATFPKPSEYSVVNRTKEVNTQLITKCCEIDFHWIPSHLVKPGNDMFDILAKDALNLPSLQEPMTYQQTIADITRKIALLVLDVHTKLANGKAWEITKFNLLYVEVRSLPIFASSPDMITGLE